MSGFWRSRWFIGLACAGFWTTGCDDKSAQWEAAIEGPAIAPAVLAAKQSAQNSAEHALSGSDDGRSILFGDLHVHTSYSQDGFLFSLPLLGGDGAHPPNDACDFARHCANLDFYARVLAEAEEAGLGVAEGVRMYVQFGSESVARFAREQGWVALFTQAGLHLRVPKRL